MDYERHTGRWGAAGVKVVEAWSPAFKPPTALRRGVERLVRAVQAQYLAGLDRIVLRDAGTLGAEEKRKRRSRKGKVLLGSYYPAGKTSPAYIDLFVDEISRTWFPWMMRVGFFRDLLVCRVLFHEVGHHIHRRIVPGHGDSEVAAEKWRKILTREALHRRYWYLLPFLRPVSRFLNRACRRRGPI